MEQKAQEPSLMRRKAHCQRRILLKITSSLTDPSVRMGRGRSGNNCLNGWADFFFRLMLDCR